MRKTLAALAITILASTHAATDVINPYPARHYYAPPLHKIAQGWGEGPRYFPRRAPWREDEGPYPIPRAEPSPYYRGPMQEDLDRYYRRRRFQHVQPGHPW
jgi:hypothetical protein